MKYPKINSLYKRDLKTKKLIIGDYSLPEFDNVKRWHITEKVDGTNVRIMIKCPFVLDGKPENNRHLSITFGGRTDNAQLPANLFEYLQKTFTVERLALVFPDILNHNQVTDITLYGEGYGPKIQNGGSYRDDVSFILFDIKIGRFWLEYENLQGIAEAMGIDVVPSFGVWENYDGDNELLPLKSMIANNNGKPDLLPEGIVAKSYPLMLCRNGERIMWKLKHIDFN